MPIGPGAPHGPGAVLPRAEARYPAAPTVDPVELDVVNTAAVPISVTSHFHFFEANPRLRFDRAAAYGRHLAVPEEHEGVPLDVGRRLEGVEERGDPACVDAEGGRGAAGERRRHGVDATGRTAVASASPRSRQRA